MRNSDFHFGIGMLVAVGLTLATWATAIALGSEPNLGGFTGTVAMGGWYVWKNRHPVREVNNGDSR